MQKGWGGRLLLAAAGTLLAAGAAVLLSGFWQCPILYYTGIPCPGCGMTRALLRLLILDFAGAAAYHPLVYLLGGYYLVLAGAFVAGRLRLGTSAWYWGSLAAIFILYGLWRAWPLLIGFF